MKKPGYYRAFTFCKFLFVDSNHNRNFQRVMC